MARRKSVEVETPPPEDGQPKRGRKKLVDAKHTITYEAPVPVTVEETEEGELLLDDDFEEIEEAPERKRKPRNEREELRKRLSTNGVTSTSQLKLSIERYMHSDSMDSGTMAEKAYCTKYACNEAHITGEDYLDIARQFGPGRYWFTLRLNNKIVTQWERRLDNIAPPQSQIAPTVIASSDPTQPPQIIYQMPQQPQQPVAVLDPLQQAKAQHALFKDKMEEYRLMKEVFGVGDAPKEENATDTLLNHPKVIDTMVDTIVTVAKKAAGLKNENSGGDDGWVGVAMEIVKSGQVKDLAAVVQVGIQTLIGGVLGSPQNGQAQMVNPPQQTHAGFIPTQASDQTATISQVQPQGPPGNDPRNVGGTAQSIGDVNAPGQPVALSPEDQALHLVIEHCKRKYPASVTYKALMDKIELQNALIQNYALQTGQLLDNQIQIYVDLFAVSDIEFVMDMLKQQPGGIEVEALPHSREWTRELQTIIQENMEGEE